MERLPAHAPPKVGEEPGNDFSNLFVRKKCSVVTFGLSLPFLVNGNPCKLPDTVPVPPLGQKTLRRPLKPGPRVSIAMRYEPFRMHRDLFGVGRSYAIGLDLSTSNRYSA